MRARAAATVLSIASSWACAGPVLAAGADLPPLKQPLPARGEAIALSSQRLPLDSQAPGQAALGAFEFRGALQLSSPHPRFGGFSALEIDASGRRLLALSDEGVWLEARLGYDSRGWLARADQGRLGALADEQGRALGGKQDGDAEAMTRLSDGSYVVSFEQRLRLWRYPRPGRRHPAVAAAAQAFAAPAELQQAPENGAIEALTHLADGRLLALAEQFESQGGLMGWVWERGAWHALTYLPTHELLPTDATLLPDGDLLVLERGYKRETGPRAAIRRLSAAAVRPGARLEPETVAELARPLLVDNSEGLFARRGDHGESLVYLMSDDNYSREQRTLLMLLALPGGSGAQPHKGVSRRGPSAGAHPGREPTDTP